MSRSGDAGELTWEDWDAAAFSIGQTGRSFRTRYKEHEDALERIRFDSIRFI